MNIPEKATHWDSHNQCFDFYIDPQAGDVYDGLWPLSDDLTWLALRCDSWAGSENSKIVSSSERDRYYFFAYHSKGYTHNQWLTRRRELGLEEPEVMPEEDEAWEELERKQGDRRGEFGSPVMQYNPDDVSFNVPHDPVNSPSHYASGEIECIDAIRASMTPDEFSGYLKGNCQKYIWRYRHKGGAQDLAKAKWYLERLEQHTKKYEGGGL